MKKQIMRSLSVLFCFGMSFLAPMQGQEIDIIELVPQLEKILADEEEAELRKKLIEELGKLSQDALQAAPVLIRHYSKEKDPEVRAMILWALNQIEPESKLVCSLYLDALTDNSEDVRENAAWSLGKLGEDAKEAVPSLVEALQDKNKHVRGDAAWALGKVKFNAQIAVPALTSALKDESKNVRKEAIWALGEFGIEAQSALPALMEANYDPDFEVRKEARNAQQKIGSSEEAILKSFLISLKHSDEEIRYKAVISLGKLGANAAKAVAPLKELLLQESSQKMHLEIIWTLSKIGESALDTTDKIATFFSSPDPRFRTDVLLALHQMNAPAHVLFPLLEKALQETDLLVLKTGIKIIREHGERAKSFFLRILLLLGHAKGNIRDEAKNTLLQLGAPPLDILPELEKALHYANPNIQEAALWAIGLLGPAAKSAYPALKRALEDPQERVRQQAKISIQQLGFVVEEPQKDPPLLPAITTPHNASQKTNIPLSKVEKETQKKILFTVFLVLFSFCFFIFWRLLQNPHSSENLIPVSTEEKEPVLSIPQLLKTLENSHWEMRLVVVQEFAKLLANHKELLYPLAMSLKDSVPEVGREAAWILAHTESDIRDATATLLQNLKYESSYPQLLSLWVLQKISPLSIEAIQACVQKLQEESFHVRYMARQTLNKQQTPALIPLLLPLLQHPQSGVRSEAICILSQQKEYTHLFAKEIVSLLNDPDEDVRHQVVLAFALLEISPEEIDPKIMEHFDS